MRMNTRTQLSSLPSKLQATDLEIGGGGGVVADCQAAERSMEEGAPGESRGPYEEEPEGEEDDMPPWPPIPCGLRCGEDSIGSPFDTGPEWFRFQHHKAIRHLIKCAY